MVNTDRSMKTFDERRTAPDRTGSSADRVERQAEGAENDSAAEMIGAASLYQQTLAALARLFQAAAVQEMAPDRLSAAMAELDELTATIVASVGEGRGLLRKATGTYAEDEGFVLPHSINVAVLAVEVGGTTGLSPSELHEICLAGLIHDLGSVRLPAGLLIKADSLTPEEWDLVRKRPQLTYDIIVPLDRQYSGVAEIAYQAYERLDGSGYPRGLQGDAIMRQALVLGAVDFFESFAHPRPYKPSIPGTANHGIQMLMQMADKFGAETLKALVNSVGLFPIGSYVRLSSGEIGRVVDVKKQNPMRPQVEVLLDKQRRAPDVTRTLNLLDNPQVYISQAMTAADLRELGLMPPPTKVPPLVLPEGNAS